MAFIQQVTFLKPAYFLTDQARPIKHDCVFFHSCILKLAGRCFYRDRHGDRAERDGDIAGESLDNKKKPHDFPQGAFAIST